MSNDVFEKTQFLSASNAVFIAELYKSFLENSSNVSQEWGDFFKSLSQEDKISFEIDFFGPEWKKKDISVINKDKDICKSQDIKVCNKEAIDNNISEEVLRNLYVKYAHISAKLDPIFGKMNDKHEDLQNAETSCNNPNWINKLSNIYTSSIGVEFDHITNKTEKKWLIERFEDISQSQVSSDKKIDALKQILQAELFEQFIHKKFPGMKRFSIEGGESAMIAMTEYIKIAVNTDSIDNVTIGMAHRGRLAMLTQIANKPYEFIFSEFHKNAKTDEKLGDIAWDVKYHGGYRSNQKINGKNVEVEIAFNPSHLEAVNPVVMGMSYAKGAKSLPILIHGDAAMIGQGIVAECLNMSGVKNYNTGGVFHLAINNQIGFTAEPLDSRSSRYCTDVAKILECPIIHVNGEDIESVLKMSQILAEYRSIFKKDVVLDLICYRKYGHNEGDEPLYTNPVMYNILKNKQPIHLSYAKNLIDANIIKSEDYGKMKEEYIKILDIAYDDALKNGIKIKKDLPSAFDNIGYNIDTIDSVSTGIDIQLASDLIEKFLTIPKDFNPNPRLKKQLETRLESIKVDKKLDWATGEMLAFASLINDGHSVRITGQDAERGTFSHRHSMLSDCETGKKYNILSKIENDKTKYTVCNSPLSEYAVLGFEYGHSLIKPNDLTIWEGQFGDFANGASTIFDQFISSAEQKWLLMSGLVVLLPHGFEGQGPEHSSARLERYLQLCAQDNMIVANCTTPANLFHILRRQIYAKYRKPLIIMSPKSLLRHKLVVSNLADFDEKSHFKPIICDTIEPCSVKKIVITSGKLYYDLLEKRMEKNCNDIAIIRIEQYYPFASEVFEKEIAKYKNANSICFAQEEPKNMGAWNFIRDYISESMQNVDMNLKLEYVGRKASASPATGFEKQHKIEQEEIVSQVIC